ncbi:hypothetical protein EYF80_067884 [Liparis tanakae]|uniref:Uncharacterized protein n=1 Tax=Liparis tanakae TaxID=230148 RepID=A0A4Z2DZQ1_9TELE|nr:hypothetical protein EYF80_067884 [Liparis tanakae]
MRRSWGSMVSACLGWTPKKAASKWLMSFSFPFLLGRPYRPREERSHPPGSIEPLEACEQPAGFNRRRAAQGPPAPLGTGPMSL